MIILPEIPTGLSVVAIQNAVSAYYSVSVLDLIGPRKDPAIFRTRAVAMWLARHYTAHSISVIARMFGSRDRTTAVHALDRIEDMMSSDPKLCADIRTIASALAATLAKKALAANLVLDRDPLEVVLEVLGAEDGRASVTASELRLIVALCTSYAIAAGDVVDTSVPTDPAEPMPMLYARELETLFARAKNVIRARDELSKQLQTRFEKPSRADFEAALDGLEAQIQMIETGAPTNG